jgi:hypothetical protein
MLPLIAAGARAEVSISRFSPWSRTRPARSARYAGDRSSTARAAITWLIADSIVEMTEPVPPFVFGP